MVTKCAIVFITKERKGQKMKKIATVAEVIEVTSELRLAIIESYRTNRIDQRKYQVEMLALANREAKLLKEAIGK